MAGVHRAQPRVRPRAVRQIPAGSLVGRRGDARALRALDAAGRRRAAAGLRRGCPLQKIVGAVNLAQSIRRYGHLAAQLDPLGSRPLGDPSLLPETHGVTEEDLRSLPANLIWSPLCAGAANMLEVIDAFRRIYCSTTGYDFAHVFVPEERQWLRQAVECGRFRAPSDPIDPVALLDRLTEVEAFERFLHRTFPGKTRFSIEGLDMLVPILDEVIGDAAEAGHAQHPDRDGAPRAPERDGARAEQAVRADPRRVQGPGLVAQRSAKTWPGPAT